MAIVDAQSRPIAAIATSAQPHEITLLQNVLDNCPCKENIRQLVGDKAYDSDIHDNHLKQQGIHLIAPHKNNRVKPPTQSQQGLKLYRKRWVSKGFLLG